MVPRAFARKASVGYVGRQSGWTVRMRAGFHPAGSGSPCVVPSVDASVARPGGTKTVEASSTQR